MSNTDCNKFIKKVTEYLNSDGIFISQFQPLSPMVELNDVGNLCHEHLEFYSYKSLVYLFEKNNLEIFKVERNKMNGGSYRIFARHYKKGSIEFKEKEYSVRKLKEFFERIENNKELKLLEQNLKYNLDFLRKQEYQRNFDDKWRDFLREQKQYEDNNIIKTIQNEIKNKEELIKIAKEHLKKGVEVKKPLGI